MAIRLAPANSIRGALFRLRSEVDTLAGHDISYEYMLRKNAYIRADHITTNTLPPEFINLYLPSGGANSDPIMENLGDMTSPMYVDLRSICREPGTKYYKNQFFQRLIKDGCPYLSAFPFTDSLDRGYGVFTIFDTRPRDVVEPLAKAHSQLGGKFHEAITSLGLFSAHFSVTEKEARVLEGMAIGKTADDISAEEGVSRRTIELRLESARKKLKAKTTTEAVFKSVSYGIINPE